MQPKQHKQRSLITDYFTVISKEEAEIINQADYVEKITNLKAYNNRCIKPRDAVHVCKQKKDDLIESFCFSFGFYLSFIFDFNLLSSFFRSWWFFFFNLFFNIFIALHIKWVIIILKSKQNIITSNNFLILVV